MLNQCHYGFADSPQMKCYNKVVSVVADPHMPPTPSHSDNTRRTLYQARTEQAAGAYCLTTLSAFCRKTLADFAILWHNLSEVLDLQF